jgi:6-pyruvoyltetrahydropterin/6-carboxytetrahydropterin synthase
MRYRSTKRFSNLPCAHRTHSHPGHCRFVHGYSRSFKFYFEASELDEHNFVVDFSALKDLRAWLEHMFDHTLLINENDPERAFFEEMHRRGLCDLRLVPSVSMEGTAKLVFEYADRMVREQTQGRAWVVKVEVRENDKNSAEIAVGGSGSD